MSITLRRPAERRLVILFVLALAAVALALWQRVTAQPASDSILVMGETETAVLTLQSRLERYPEDANTYAQLGLAYLQRVRETADPQLYTRAEQAFHEALTRDPQQPDALLGQGMLALARHDFAAALVWGQQARQANPYRAQMVGILVDAYVELGRYEEAVAAAQTMVDLRPDLASYSRVSYLRELHGDVDGAIEAMTTAVALGAPTSEETAWVKVQLGNLYYNNGDFDTAAAIYEEALYFYPDYAYAVAGLGRVQAARGEYEAAIAMYEPLVQRLPLPEFAIMLGDLYTVTHQPEMADRQYELVRLMQQLNAQAGMDVDLELALFEADHGDAARAVEMARGAYGRRPSLYAADVLAWALYQNGEWEEAWLYSQEALRLGTQDALWRYHAGKIALALGLAEIGQEELATAVKINPAFSLLFANE